MGLITDIGVELGSIMGGIDTGSDPELKAQLWVPKTMPRLPSLCIIPPDLTMTGDVWTDGEDIGSYEWELNYTCCLYVDMSDMVKGQQRAVDYTEKIIKAVQANPSLNGTVVAAKVMTAQAELVSVTLAKGSKAAMEYTFGVAALRFEQ